MTDRLIVFARAPEPGRVKTRLSPPLSPVAAAALYEACLRDVLALAAHIPARAEIWYGEGPLPPEAPLVRRTHPTEVTGAGPVLARSADDYFAREFPELRRTRQARGDLGVRMEDAFDGSFASGAGRVLLIGSDAPTLAPTVLHTAFHELSEKEAVLGPAADGGYYLIGLRREAWPASRVLFRDIPWSGVDVLRTTLARAAGAGIGVGLLAEWYDIDRPEDLVRAAADARPDSHVGRWLAGPDGGRYIPRP